MFIDKFLSQDIKIIFTFNGDANQQNEGNLLQDISQSIQREPAIKNNQQIQKTIPRDGVALLNKQDMNQYNSNTPKRQSSRKTSPREDTINPIYKRGHCIGNLNYNLAPKPTKNISYSMTPVKSNLKVATPNNLKGKIKTPKKIGCS